MNNTIKLIDDILKNMEYIELLLTEGHKYVTPLNTFNLVVKQLNQLRVILNTEYLTPDQIREAVIRLEKPIKIKDRLYETGTPTDFNTFKNDPIIFTGVNPFCRDSVGTEELL